MVKVQSSHPSFNICSWDAGMRPLEETRSVKKSKPLYWLSLMYVKGSMGSNIHQL